MGVDFRVTQPLDGAFFTAFVGEFFLAFLLMFVILAVATDTRLIGGTAAIAVGGTIAFSTLFGGPVTGASMNPARSLGPTLLAWQWNGFAAYLAGPVLGSVAGALFYQGIRCNRPEPGEPRDCC